MSCTTLTSITKGCDNNSGGIKEIYLWGTDDRISGPTVDTSSWLVTALSVSGVAGGTAASAPISYSFLRNTSNYTEESNIDLANGSSYVTQTVNLVFNRREAAKSKSIKILGEGQRYLDALIKDANGNYWFIPELQLTATGEGSGTAKADGSKYSVTLTAENEFLAYGMGASAALALISSGVGA